MARSEQTLGAKASDVIVVVNSSDLLQLRRCGHVNEAVPAVVHRLSDPKDIVDRKVEQLHKKWLLIAKEASAGDEPRAKAVNFHTSACLAQPPL
jgi:hypothetical protein